MKRYLLTLLIAIPTLVLGQQGISVKSFDVIPNNMDARVNFPKRDQNGEVCAIIKVVTTQKDFAWEADGLGIVSAEYKTGEFWLYVPRGAQRLTIKHDKLGILRDYRYPIAIQAATVYVMELVTGTVEVVVKEAEIETQWLIITSEPTGSDVYINDQPAGKTPYQNELPLGKYTWRVSSELFLPEAGIVELKEGSQRETITLNLKPNFGAITVKTTPEVNAKVFVNGMDMNKVTPCTLERIPAGNINISAKIDFYEIEPQQINVTAGSTPQVTLVANATFGTIQVSSNPEGGASVSLDGVSTGKKTPCTLEKIPIGEHVLTLNRENCKPETRKITLASGQILRVEFDLATTVGNITIASKPESGASVSLNGIPTNKTTPCTLERIPEGEHTLTLTREWYETTTKRVTLQAGQNLPLDVDMNPTFADVTITTEPEADIFINNQRKGNGKWTGRLNPAVYTIEARLDKHATATERQTVMVGQPVNITLKPTPKTGTLKIVTTPFDAQIKLNGKDYGLTPVTLKDILIGSYTLTLTKSGFGEAVKTITIDEGKTTEVNETLPKGIEVTIASKPAGAQLWIDGVSAGSTPVTTTLGFGNYTLRMVNGKKEVKDQISITPGGKTRWEYNVSEFDGKNFTQRVAGVTIDMVAVQGGTFTMGCTSEQGSSCKDSEMPAHQVTVGSFYMGKYPVTQAQWKAIMGSNPSNFSGCDQCPVENVSWIAAQRFISKLNQLTGKKYRLPTEAEWEYTARGGVKSRGYKYSGSNILSNVAWYFDNSESKTHPVGQKRPNELGIYDMSGNVWEWCSDCSHNNYNGAPTDGSSWEDDNFNCDRVRRGGSWSYSESYCRLTFRYYFWSRENIHNGFRVVFAP